VEDKLTCTVVLYDIMLLLFSMGEGCFLLSMHPEEYLHKKTTNKLPRSHYALLCACTE